MELGECETVWKFEDAALSRVVCLCLVTILSVVCASTFFFPPVHHLKPTTA